MARSRPLSRPRRWAVAVSAAHVALLELDGAYANLDTALGDLRSLQEEYGEWKDNLPDNLQGSPLAEKLDAIADLELPEDARNETYEDLDTAISEAESVDLPLGFGRD